MPLVSTGQSGVPDNGRQAVGFWMTVEGADPVEPIRVFVTYEALAQIDPTTVRDAHAAIEIFNENRARIEQAANRKLEADGVDDGSYEGRPILIVRSDDLPG